MYIFLLFGLLILLIFIFQAALSTFFQEAAIPSCHQGAHFNQVSFIFLIIILVFYF